MFWSAALDLKTQRPPSRPLGASYGSFSRSASNGSFHIPQSIPEHQPVSQFTSPLPDQRRVEEYFERPDTAFARTRASLQLSERTQTALKLLLQGDRNGGDPLQRPKPTQASAKPKFAPDMYSMSKISGYSARQAPMKKLPERTPLLKPLARSHGQEEPNPQENSNEHNYWMQELERRRAGLRRSRRRTCTPMSERATTSPLKVGVVMCSVPLVLVLGFVLFVMLFGDGSDASNNVTNAMNSLLGIGGDNDPDSIAARHDAAAEHRGKIARTFARPPEEIQFEEDSPVMALDVSPDQTRLRGSQKEKQADE
ncbi:GntR family transcriptional regulator [Phytophthora cinnamomi]|uniref:GntR family transcriptional regulator n=1 Tax=Phytophthora cinnamomi TaxID=4785 RepID=UPI003559D5CA|nr:GntR family transcriptional regulator [Phytophthora cinnamomi]